MHSLSPKFFATELVHPTMQQDPSVPAGMSAILPDDTQKLQPCRFCGSQIPQHAVKCAECKSIQKINFKAIADSQLLLTVATPISALVAAITYLVTIITPYYSSVSFDPVGRNAGIRYYIITNPGNANAHLVRASTRIYFSPLLRKAASLPETASDGDFLTAAPLTAFLENGVIPPGGKPVTVQMQDYQPTKDGVITTNYHFDAMVNIIERKLTKYAAENNKIVTDALVELLTYLVGIDDSATAPEVDNRLGDNFIFRVDFFYMDYNRRQKKHSDNISPREYTYWITNYADIRNKKSPLCQRIRKLIDRIRAAPLKFDENRLYRGLCF